MERAFINNHHLSKRLRLIVLSLSFRLWKKESFSIPLPLIGPRCFLMIQTFARIAVEVSICRHFRPTENVAIQGLTEYPRTQLQMKFVLQNGLRAYLVTRFNIRAEGIVAIACKCVHVRKKDAE